MVTDIKHYKKQKKREKKVSVFYTIVTLLLKLAVPLMIIIGVMFFSPFFVVDNIEFSGNFYLDRDLLNDYVEEAYGTNLFLINKSVIKKQLLTNSYVEDVTIKRHLPKTIGILLSERTPVALIVTNDGFIQVSKDAIFLDIRQTPRDFSLPIVTGVEFFAIPGVGQKIENQVLEEALGIITGSNPLLMSKIAEINIHNNRITAYTRSGVTVLLGGSEDIINKLKVLEGILQDIINVKIDAEDVEHIDLRFKDTYVIKRFDD